MFVMCIFSERASRVSIASGVLGSTWLQILGVREKDWDAVTM